MGVRSLTCGTSKFPTSPPPRTHENRTTARGRPERPTSRYGDARQWRAHRREPVLTGKQPGRGRRCQMRPPQTRPSTPGQAHLTSAPRSGRRHRRPAGRQRGDRAAGRAGGSARHRPPLGHDRRRRRLGRRRHHDSATNPRRPFNARANCRTPATDNRGRTVTVLPAANDTGENDSRTDGRDFPERGLNGHSDRQPHRRVGPHLQRELPDRQQTGQTGSPRPTPRAAKGRAGSHRIGSGGGVIGGKRRAGAAAEAGLELLDAVVVGLGDRHEAVAGDRDARRLDELAGADRRARRRPWPCVPSGL